MKNNTLTTKVSTTFYLDMWIQSVLLEVSGDCYAVNEEVYSAANCDHVIDFEK